MPFSLRGQFGFLASLVVATGVRAAEPRPFSVDPALLAPAAADAPRASAGMTDAGGKSAPVSVSFPVGRDAERKPEPAAATPVPVPIPAVTPPPADSMSAYPSLRRDFLPEPVLSYSPRMLPLLRDSGEPRPLFVAADRIRGKTEFEVVAEGAAELRKIGTVVNGDRLTYREQEDVVEAVGNVRLENGQDLITGPEMRLKVEDSVGYFRQPKYSMTRAPVAPAGFLAPRGQETTASGEAERIDFEGPDHYRLKNATYTTCAPGAAPEWFAEAG